MEKGAGSEADAFLKLALKADPKVAKYLTGDAEIPTEAPMDEAELESVTTAMLLRDAWAQAAKAREWLVLVEKTGSALVQEVPAPPPANRNAPPPKAKRDGPRSID